MKEILESFKDEQGNAKLTVEEIKSVLAKNGQIVDNEISKVKEKYEITENSYKETISKLEEQVKSLPDTEELNKIKDELQKMKDAEAERVENERIAQEQSVKEERTNAFFNDVKFASNSAKAGVIAEFNKMDFKYDETNKKYIGANEWLEDYKKNDAGAFLSDVVNPKFTTNTTTPTQSSTNDELRKAMGLGEKK